MKQLEKIFQSLIEVFIETTSPVYEEEVENKSYFSHKNSDLWQPVARINPFAPISIIILNNTAETLQYGFINEENLSEQLLPGEIAIINSVPKEAYFFTEPENFMTCFKYDLIVTNNFVRVKVKLNREGKESNRVLNLAADGGIYVY